MASSSKYSRGPGDSILALLEPGEYVLNRNAVDEIGKKNLDELNFEDAPRFDMSKRGQMMMAQTGGMLGDMMGYQTGGDIYEKLLEEKLKSFDEEAIRKNVSKKYGESVDPSRYFGSANTIDSDVDLEKALIDKLGIEKAFGGRFRQILSIPASEVGDGEGLRYYQGIGQYRGSLPDERLQGSAIRGALEKMQSTPQDSIPKALLGYQLGGILGMQGGGSTLEYAGATTETQTLKDIYAQMNMIPNPQQRPGFEEKWAYDPSREGVIFEDYARAITGATQKGQQNLMGAGQKMQQMEAKSGFAGSGAGQQAQEQARGNIMQDFLAQEGAAKSSLFKGVRAEREGWAADVSNALGRLDSDEGTLGYDASGGGSTISSLNVDTSQTGPPGWPTVGAYNQWVAAGRDPNNMTTYGWSDPGTGDSTKTYSDVRLKKDINYIFTMNNGVPIYSFKYKWSDDVSIGTMAQDIEDMIPEAIAYDSNGYKMVNYSKVFNYGKI